MGPYRGGQAQYIRVPYADFNALKLPPGSENEADFIVRALAFTALLPSLARRRGPQEDSLVALGGVSARAS